MHRFSIGVIHLIFISPAADFPLSFFSGFKNKDVAFFHPQSKTLIQADLLFNFPCHEQVCVPSHMIMVSVPNLDPIQYSKSKMPLLGNLKPSLWFQQRMVGNLSINTAYVSLSQ